MDRGFHLVVSRVLLPACFCSILTTLETKPHTHMCAEAVLGKSKKENDEGRYGIVERSTKSVW
jgi:hypothetical protein